MPTIRRILVPFDYSPAADAALDLAGALARAWGAGVLVVHFLPVEVRSLGDYDVVKGDPASIADETARLQARVAARLADTEHVDAEAMWSGPSLHIVETAIERDVDLIVMGTTGGAAEDRALGVAERTMRLAPCSVLTVPGPASAPDAAGLRTHRPEHQVRTLMTRDPVTIGPEETLSDAACKMTAAEVRHLPVVGSGRLVGILSDLDLPGYRGYFERTMVRTAMTPEPITIAANAPVSVAARLMLDHRVRALPVVDGARVIGIVSSTDILEEYVRAAREEA